MKKLISILVAFAMMMTLCVSAFAAVAGTEGSPATGSLTKDFQVADDVTAPNAAFTFNFTQDAADAVKKDVPAITISYANGEKGIKTADLGLTNLYTSAGRYNYTVAEAETGWAEDSDANTTETLDYSKATYKMIVDVANKSDGSGVYVKNIAVQKLTNDDGSAVTGEEKVNPSTPTEPGQGNGFKFENVYGKDTKTTPDGEEDPKPSDPDDDDTGDNGLLYIEKKVAGDLADHEKQFDFSLTLTKPSVLTNAQKAEPTYKYQIIDLETKQAGAVQTGTYGQALVFQLKHNERLVVTEAIAGSAWEASETVDADYDPAAAAANATVNAANSGATAGKIAKGTNNDLRVTNTYNKEGTTPTGILMNNLPYILLAVVAAGGLIAYLMMKRREANAEA